MGGHLGAGVAGADHHEGAAGLPLRRVRGGAGHLHLPGDVVAQVEGLRHTAEAVGVLGHSGDGQQLVDAAHGEDEPVVGHLAGASVRVPPGDPAGVQIDAVDLAQHQPDMREGAGEGDRDPPGLQDPGRHFGQQRQIQEVVVGIDQDDVRRAAQGAGERTGGLVTGEAGADDHYAYWAHTNLPGVR